MQPASQVRTLERGSKLIISFILDRERTTSLPVGGSEGAGGGGGYSLDVCALGLRVWNGSKERKIFEDAARYIDRNARKGSKGMVVSFTHEWKRISPLLTGRGDSK